MVCLFRFMLFFFSIYFFGWRRICPTILIGFLVILEQWTLQVSYPVYSKLWCVAPECRPTLFCPVRAVRIIGYHQHNDSNNHKYGWATVKQVFIKFIFLSLQNLYIEYVSIENFFLIYFQKATIYNFLRRPPRSRAEAVNTVTPIGFTSKHKQDY